MKVLITGGCGFLGSNLTKSFLDSGDKLFLIDSLFREGSSNNLKWLYSKDKLKNMQFFNIDISEREKVNQIFKNFGPFDYVCHVAGQVAMTSSIINPFRDFTTNALGTFNILEACRKFSPNAFLAYSSTNKVYGDLEYLIYKEDSERYIIPKFPNGLNENLQLDFSTPYGCSKGSADQYVKDWSRVFGLKTVVFRHSSIYGGRQYSSFDQGWIGWFCMQALKQEKALKYGNPIKPFTVTGNGKQVRDVLHANDLVNLYKEIFNFREKVSGEVFNIGGGLSNSLSLLELFNLLQENIQVDKLNFEFVEKRSSDQKVFIADISKIKKLIGWEPKINKNDGIVSMLEWSKIILNKNE